MSDTARIIEAALFCFVLSAVLSPIIIRVIKKQKIKQTILCYVEAHQGKAGTPTMGGIIFVVSIVVSGCLFMHGASHLFLAALIVFFGFALTGFLDDYIKFRFKRNLGLKAYQKIIFQLIIGIGIGFFAYYSRFIQGQIIIPFTGITVSLGWWIVPFSALVMIASTNSVNLTDGLDGLAATTTLCYFLCFIGLMVVLITKKGESYSTLELMEYKNIIMLSAVVVAAMLAFLLFNSFPAKIFMGDTGSLALGALVGGMAVVTKTALYVLMMGIMFVLSSVSVIIQVAYYKMTKKRVFLMAPLHHHFEKKGVFEGKIVVCYGVITLVVGVAVVLIELLL